MTPQRKKDNPLYITGLEEGAMFNTVTADIYGEKVEVIPLIFSKSRIYFRDLKEGGGILCQSFNGIDGGTISPTCAACPNSHFGAKGEAPLCNVFMNFASLLTGSKQLIAASFKSSGLKAARGWVTRLQMFNKPAYTQVYEIKTIPAKNQKGDFFAPVITFKRWATEEEFKFAAAQFAAIKGQNIVVDTEHEVDDEYENRPF
jgi:hypothetical protein